MKIGFEAKRAIENNTGLGNYARYVIEALSTYYPQNEYLLFAPKKKENPRLAKIYRQPNIKFVFPDGIAKLFAPLWRHYGLAKTVSISGAEIFHGLCNQITVGLKGNVAPPQFHRYPFLRKCSFRVLNLTHFGKNLKPRTWGFSTFPRVKSVVTIHDTIFLRYPKFYKPLDRLIYKWKFGYACRNADRIVAVSECTKRDIQKFFHVPAEKICVIYQGCHPAFSEIVSAEKKAVVAKKYELPPRFVLYVGSIEERKNLLLVVRALEHLPEEIHLAAVGRKTDYQSVVEECAEKSGVIDRLHILNNVSFEDLPAMYQLASVFVFPSFFEGFGIPIIEALSSGTPVIAARGSCLEEAGGPNSIYVDPNSETELAETLSSLWNNPAKCRQMVEAGHDYVKRFDAKKMADDLMLLYKTL